MSGNGLLKIVALALIGCFMAARPSLSEERCILRAGNFELEPNRHFAGMFRIPLNPPDLHDLVAVQRHLVLSETWTDIIFRGVRGKPVGLCSALAIPIPFPDLRVFLMVNRTASQIDREKAVCTQALEDFLKHFQPNDELIKLAAKRNAFFRRPLPASGDRAEIADAAKIMEATLPLIYEKGSLLHTLTSVEWTPFGAVDPADFRAWIESQRSPERPLLESIPRCLPARGDLASYPGAPRERSDSGILPAGEIDLSRSSGGPLLAGPLRYVVVVGDPDQPPGTALASEVDTKYCNREHTFSIGGGFSPRVSVTIRPRCQTTSVYDLDSWTMIYCDPADCAPEGVEKAVMTAIASDPEVLDFARRSSDTASPRGPYLVTIK
jgi:hypothetical protein